MTEELSPRERRHQRTQQAILDAALEIIHEKGVDGLSIRAIADKIDYSPAGLYEYYGSKEEIIAALCMQGLERFGRHLASVDRSLPTEEYMGRLGLAYVDFAMKNSDFFLLMFTTAPIFFPQSIKDSMPEPNAPDSTDLAVHLANDDAFMILVRGVERCVAEGIFKLQPDFSTLEMAHAFWSIAHGIAMLQLTALQQMPYNEQSALKALRVLFDGMRSQ